MVLPIVAYGHPNLRKISVDISPDYPDLNKLILDMFETMYSSNGVGLAAPQVNKQIRLFIVDAEPYADEIPEAKGFKKVFINARITERKGDLWFYNEGCLSIPGVHEDVERESELEIEYLDEKWQHCKEKYNGTIGRIIMHEYDHLDGKLFTDHLSSIRRMLLKKKLTDISKGEVNIKYKMIFPNKKKGKG